MWELRYYDITKMWRFTYQVAIRQKLWPSDWPHHPKDFGVSKPVMCTAHSQWFVSWPFLHYGEGLHFVYCTFAALLSNCPQLKKARTLLMLYEHFTVVFINNNLSLDNFRWKVMRYPKVLISLIYYRISFK